MSHLVEFGLYRPNDTIWHRIRPGWKLAGLFVLSLVVVLVRDARLSLVVLATVVGALAWARTPWGVLWRSVRVLLVMAVLLAVYHVWRSGPEHAIAVVAGLVALVLAASLVTSTTPVDDMVDTITAALSPLHVVGVRPERVALTFSLAIRAVPATMELALETRDAARARGLDRSIRALMMPLLLRVVARALSTGEALQARGVADD